MIDDTFRIYVDQLQEGKQEEIREKADPSFLGIHEAALVFDEPVEINGVAYTATGNLVLQLSASTKAKIPCSICNEWVSIGIDVPNFYQTAPLSEIKSGIFSCKDAVREAILLEVPQFAECNQGSCPGRKEIAGYLKKAEEDRPVKRPDEEGYQPFADLDGLFKI